MVKVPSFIIWGDAVVILEHSYQFVLRNHAPSWDSSPLQMGQAILTKRSASGDEDKLPLRTF